MTCAYDRLADPTFTIFFAGFILSLPIIITAYCYIRIFLFWRQVSLKVAAMSKQNNTNQSNSMKLAKLMFTLFFIYVLSWIPFGVVVNFDRDNTYSEIIHKLVVFIAHGNSTINPILYGLSNRQFKEAYINLLRKIFCIKKKTKTPAIHTTTMTI